VGGVATLYHADRLQLSLLGPEMLEEPAALAEQDRDEVDLQLVQ
jgi:hypothetical protein